MALASASSLQSQWAVLVFSGNVWAIQLFKLSLHLTIFVVPLYTVYIIEIANTFCTPRFDVSYFLWVQVPKVKNHCFGLYDVEYTVGSCIWCVPIWLLCGQQENIQTLGHKLIKENRFQVPLNILWLQLFGWQLHLYKIILAPSVQSHHSYII